MLDAYQRRPTETRSANTTRARLGAVIRVMHSQSDGAFEEFVTAQLMPLSRLALYLSGDPHLADDLVQQTVTKLYLRWHKIDEISHPDRYARTVLLREFISERRLPWWRVKLVADHADVAHAPTADTDQRLVLQAALAKLPRRQRAVLVLRFLCDLSVEETAAELGCSEGTVKSQTSHGLTALRRHLVADTTTPLTNLIQMRSA
jgi:RNA polymerase sigma-70 factor (sigma-E family)